ncbi:hypothetical protein [Pseudomonas guariconensis]|uniref:hypothetical protein n=1 Tax=Pseudomonas guariconensis TaxID=1288410 RepID=UPI0018A975D7|nr:hypothetical protein [Pseudomonas guariconensis]MBF8742112.1 hypothetical protein [Pseudomonas guariconensis]MBF8751108.1 hypothetical protein [Pseudomonas guariconensis]
MRDQINLARGAWIHRAAPSRKTQRFLKIDGQSKSYDAHKPRSRLISYSFVQTTTIAYDVSADAFLDTDSPVDQK